LVGSDTGSLYNDGFGARIQNAPGRFPVYCARNDVYLSVKIFEAVGLGEVGCGGSRLANYDFSEASGFASVPLVFAIVIIILVIVISLSPVLLWATFVSESILSAVFSVASARTTIVVKLTSSLVVGSVVV
jgi:hypothetical protein